MAGRVKSNKESISQVLPNLLHEKGWEKQLDLHSIFPAWEELVGEEMSENARPLKIERGVLWLEVTNSSWLQQFQYEKMELLETLNRFLRLSSLKDIKMILPKGKTGNNEAFEKKPDSTIEFIRPSEASIASFQQQVGCIADEKCREALMQFWYLAQACKRKTE